MKRLERGSGEVGGILLVVALVVGFFVLIGMLVGSAPSHARHVKKVTTKDHHVFLRNDDDSWFEFIVPDSGNATRGSWSRVPSGPKEEDVEEEEDTTVTEGDTGQPDAGGSDSGSDTGGDSGDSGGDGGE